MLNAHARRAYAALTAYNALADMGARPVINGSRCNTDARFDHTPDLGPFAVVWTPPSVERFCSENDWCEHCAQMHGRSWDSVGEL